MEQPNSRAFELVRELDGELIIVDPRHDVAHRLAPDAAAVWRACDGTRSPAALAGCTGLSADTVSAALADLRELDLLDDGASQTRRTVLRRVLVGGAVVTGIPLITSVALPTAAQAFDSQPHMQPRTEPPPTRYESNSSTTTSSTSTTTGSSAEPTATITPSSRPPRPAPGGARGELAKPRRKRKRRRLPAVAGTHATSAPGGGAAG
ncbi:MAG: hypothetical protein ACJ762_11885, partial [Solirubrobacteraceae bacterium]